MQYWPFVVNVGLMLGLPLWVARQIQVRRQPGWGLFFIGGATFILSQVGHIPFNFLVLQRFHLFSTDFSQPLNLVLYAIFVGLSAGLFEEVSRWLTYRYWATEARSWGRGMMLGAGHGGTEAILLAVLVAINYVTLFALQHGSLWERIPAAQWGLIQTQLDAVLQARWYDVLLAAAERAFALCLHLVLSLWVMRAVGHRRIGWLLLAVGWHALADALAVWLLVTRGVYAAEVGVGLMALVSVGLVLGQRSPEPVETAVSLPPLPLPKTAVGGAVPHAPIETTPESLDKSRYIG